MHPKKAQALANCEEGGDIVAGTVRDVLSAVAQPWKYGWQEGLVLAALLPLHAVNLLLMDATAVMIARSADETWESAFPSPPGGESDSDPTT